MTLSEEMAKPVLERKTQEEECQAAYGYREEGIKASGRGYEVGDVCPEDDHTPVGKIDNVHHAPDDREPHCRASVHPAQEYTVNKDLEE